MTFQLISKMLVAFLVVPADDTVDYQKQVRHVLQARCFACHGALKQESGLRVDTAASAISGGDGGPAIVPGDSAASVLLRKISSTDPAERMPPEGEALKSEEIASIRRWIDQGAKAPAEEKPETDPREHWAFRTAVRSPVPAVERAHWVLNPVDAFIAESYQRHGLMPQPATDRRTWLRRVTLDLIGLPPTHAEQAAFLADASADAYETVVTRLLDSPQYGERWGRHWMDIWRYSDWWGLGAEVRNSQKHIWHWRDWIIESLNDDKPYDQMLREMLAADELYPKDLDRLRASGFLARQYFKFNRTSWLDETIEHTSKAMLGLTVNCCKCHDHKYDPISQVEYYQMRAFFEPYQIRTDAVPGELDFEKDGVPRAFDCHPDAPTFVHIRGDDRNPDTSRLILPAVPTFLSIGDLGVQPVMLPVESHHPGLRSHVIEACLAAAEASILEACKELETARQELAASEKAEREKDANPANDQNSDQASTILTDDFSAAKPEVWEQRAGIWAYLDGRLFQSQTGASRATLRLKQLPPHDFQASLKYVPIGGEMWKSVGIRFDIGDDDGEILLYLSSYAGGPKAQVSYRKSGNQAYPAEGTQARSVDLNEPHELTVRVRGTLVNMIVDGQQSVAYRLPIDRRPGALELITFDAQAELRSFSLCTLPESTMLVEAAVGKPADGSLPLDQAILVVRAAEKSLMKFEAEPESVRFRAAAERARIEQPDSPDTKELIAEAARSEIVVAVAKAEEELARAELAVMQAEPEKLPAAEARLVEAGLALERNRHALEMPGESFTPLSGAIKTLENNLETVESRRKPFPSNSTGRRSALARWITDPRHPLPARVAVNHIWARHFGTGLVPTVFDFGRKGALPTHPELLDWLAVEFVESGWSMKHMHRMLVLSNTYRMTSSVSGAAAINLSADPDNRLYWRRNPLRMEAQVVRDSLLSLAGKLDLAAGGPSIPVNDEKSRRRSLYFVHSHNEHHQFLSTFDDASVLECYRRTESIVPQQALALENSRLASEMAGEIVRQIETRLPGVSDDEFVRESFRTVLSTEPSLPETAAALEALSQFDAAAVSAHRPNPQQHAKVGLLLALLNHNDFVTVR